MIRAAIVADAAGYCGVVVTTGDGLPIETLAAESLEIGHVPGRPADGSYLPGLKREVTPTHIAELVAKVVDLLCEHQPERILIERPADKSRIAGEVAGALVYAIEGAGFTAVERVDTEWRARLGKTMVERRDAARVIVSQSFQEWPEKTFDSITFAGAMLIVRDMLPPDATVSQSETTSQELAAELAKEEPPPRPASPSRATEQEPTPSPPSPLEGAGETYPPSVCGIDPGSRSVGIAIASVNGGPIVHRQTIMVGREVKLPKPKIIKRADGSEHQRTHQRVIELEDVKRLLETVNALLRKYNVRKVVLEWIQHARIHGTGAVAASTATNIARAQWVGGAIHGMCESMTPEIEVKLVAARTWVAAVTGVRSTKGRRGAIAPAVEARFPELAGADEHVRDSAGLIMWEAMPPKAAKPAKSRRPGAPKAKRVWSHAARSERNARKRAEAGCTCASRRHRRDCPLFKPMRYKESHGTQS